MESKQLKKEIKKTINVTTKICRNIPCNDIEKTLQELNEKVYMLDISELENISNNKDLLEQRFKLCTKIKKDTDKIFTRIIEYKLNLSDKNKELAIQKEKFTSYIPEIEKCLKIDSRDNFSELRILVQQNISILEQWLKNNKKLIEQLDNSYKIAVNTFKNYIDKITKLQRELYK